MYLIIGIALIALGIFIVAKRNEEDRRSKEVHTCPRCLGKGHVDELDIARLNRKADWKPGKCMYCAGKGKVLGDMIAKIPADEQYLNSALDATARKLFVKGDANQKRRAELFNTSLNIMKEEIIGLYTLQHLSAGDIATKLIAERGIPPSDYAQLVVWVEKVIAAKHEQ